MVKKMEACLLVIVIAMLFTFTLPAASAQHTDSERRAVASEISSALENYHRVFSTESPSEIARQIYGVPLIAFFADGKTTIWNTEKDVEVWIKDFITKLKEQGWHRSYMPSPQICVLGDGSGFASGQFIRYREDGSEISRTGMAYIFQKRATGWKMVGFLAHDVDQHLACVE